MTKFSRLFTYIIFFQWFYVPSHIDFYIMQNDSQSIINFAVQLEYYIWSYIDFVIWEKDIYNSPNISTRKKQTISVKIIHKN
jgi:hypothetical protein